MTTIFCSNESVSLERSVEVQSDVSAIEEIWTKDEQEKCIKWIKENNFNKVKYILQIFILFTINYKRSIFIDLSSVS